MVQLDKLYVLISIWHFLSETRYDVQNI